MRKYIAERLREYRHKLEQKLRTFSWKEGNVFNKSIWEIKYKVCYIWYCVIDCLVVWLGGVLICALYVKEYEKCTSSHGTFMRIIAENKDEIEPVIFDEGNGTDLLVFYSRNLKKISHLFEDNSEMRELYRKVIKGHLRRCKYCGCRILGPFPYTYRDIGGCVGKTIECYICRDFSNTGVNQIRDYYIKHGSEKTVMKAMNGGFEDEGEEF